MPNRAARLVLLTTFLTLPACLAQTQSMKPPAYIENPESILHLWNCLGAHKNVTHEYPTDYQYGKTYRLKTEIFVNIGGTSSCVSRYWASEKAIVEKYEVLGAGTRFRFGQIWLEGNFETGIYVRCYAECLDGALRGKQIEIRSISDMDGPEGKQQCKVDPKRLELIAE